MSAHFEHTVAVTATGAIDLNRLVLEIGIRAVAPIAHGCSQTTE